MVQKLKSFTIIFIFVIAALGLTISSARAAILTVDGGQLTGATNVDLGGLGFFNVSFVDGSCIDLFTGCDAVSDFDFDNPTDATIAAFTLSSQVFIDNHPTQPLFSFDSEPELTSGCSNTALCIILIPYGFSEFEVALAGGFVNRDGASVDNFSGTFVTDISTDLSTNTFLTFAQFSPITPVPLPPAMLLFGSALVALFGYCRFGMRCRRQA